MNNRWSVIWRRTLWQLKIVKPKPEWNYNARNYQGVTLKIDNVHKGDIITIKSPKKYSESVVAEDGTASVGLSTAHKGEIIVQVKRIIKEEAIYGVPQAIYCDEFGAVKKR